MYLLALFIFSFSWGDPVINFITGDRSNFNAAVFERHIYWVINRELTELVENKEFHKSFASWIKREKEDFYIARLNDYVRLPKYYFWISYKNSKIVDIELGLFSKQQAGEVWGKKGKTSKLLYLADHKGLPDSCRHKPEKSFSYYVFDTAKKLCTKHRFDLSGYNPVISGKVFVGKVGAKSFKDYTLIKTYLKLMHDQPPPDIIVDMGRNWRITASRFRWQKDGGELYFP